MKDSSIIVIHGITFGYVKLDDDYLNKTSSLQSLCLACAGSLGNLILGSFSSFLRFLLSYLFHFLAIFGY